MSLIRSKAVLELDEKLVAQLERDDDDLLTSWMAHYTAQQVEEAKKAPTETKLAAQDACARAILELWQYRSSLPKHLRPYKQLEVIQKTLASLDISQTKYHYYSNLLQEVAAADADEEVKQQPELAVEIDYSAHLLIRSALRAAVQLVEPRVEPWIQLARHIDEDESLESKIMALVSGGDNEEERRKDALLDQVSRLELFSGLAMLQSKKIRDELESLQSNETEED